MAFKNTSTVSSDMESALIAHDSLPGTMFSVGMRVRHPEFGNGKIIEKSGTGESLKVMVLFESGKWKKLVVKYAGLQKL